VARCNLSRGPGVRGLPQPQACRHGVAFCFAATKARFTKFRGRSDHPVEGPSPYPGRRPLYPIRPRGRHLWLGAAAHGRGLSNKVRAPRFQRETGHGNWTWKLDMETGHGSCGLALESRCEWSTSKKLLQAGSRGQDPVRHQGPGASVGCWRVLAQTQHPAASHSLGLRVVLVLIVTGPAGGVAKPFAQRELWGRHQETGEV
jgi:hypothetical protein